MVLVLRVSKWHVIGSFFLRVVAFYMISNVLLGAIFESINSLPWLVGIWKLSDVL